MSLSNIIEDLCLFFSVTQFSKYTVKQHIKYFREQSTLGTFSDHEDCVKTYALKRVLMNRKCDDGRKFKLTAKNNFLTTELFYIQNK